MFTAPTNSKANTHFKTINTDYIELVKKSDIFMDNFVEIMNK